MLFAACVTTTIVRHALPRRVALSGDCRRNDSTAAAPRHDSEIRPTFNDINMLQRYSCRMNVSMP